MVIVLIVAFLLPGKKKLDQSRKQESNKTTGMLKKVSIKPTGNRLQRARKYFKEVRQSLTMSPLMFPAMFAQTFALGLLTPVLTLYMTKILGLSGAQFRYILLAGGAVTVLFMLPVGKLVDKWGTKWFLHIGFLLSSLVLIAFTFTKSLAVLYIMVILLGASYAFIIPAWNALIAAAIPPDKRGAVWGFFLTIEGMGTTIGPIVSGKIWDDLGYHAPYVASGSVLFVLFLIHLYISLKRKAKAA
jgi:MFS family permease